MTKQEILIIGNWKMNLGPSEAARFAHSLRESLPSPLKARVWVAPSALSAAGVVSELSGSPIKVGAQNVHWAASGAFTGESSPLFAKELGLTFAILGHSERRTLFGETSLMVSKRMKAAIDAGLTPVVCIGETEDERVAGDTKRVLTEQLEPIFAVLNPETGSKVVLAYEPVWAIGTGKVASEGEIHGAHDFIRSLWDQQCYNAPATILYGGSVTPTNFPGIAQIPGVDGALVGGASIKLDQWLELIAIANR